MSTRARELGDRRAVVALLVLVLAAACLALGITAPGPTEVVTWWPAVGVVAVLATVTSRSWWWWALPLALLANGSANLVFGRPLDLSVVLSLIVVAEGALFAVLVRRRPGGPTMVTQRDFLRLFAAACLSAGLGGVAGALAIPPVTGTGDSRDLLLTIAPSHAAAILVITPLALSWRRSLLPIRGSELVLQSTILTVAAIGTFWFSDALAMTFLPLPFLVWAAFQFGLRVVAWQVAALALVATGSTALNRGPFAVGFDSDSLLAATSLVQTFLVCMVLICVPLAVNVEQGRRLLERVRASSELFRQNFSESLLSILVLRTGDGRLEIFDANTTSAGLLGRRVDRLIGLPLDAVVATDTPMAEVTASMLQGSLDGWRDEGTLVDRPGSRIAVSIARLAGPYEEPMFSAQLLDLTTEREATAGLRAERALTDITLDATPCFILVADMRGTVLRVNRATTRITGFPEKHLVGRPIWETITSPESREAVRAMYDDPSGRGIVGAGESGVNTRDGDLLRILWSNDVVRDEHGDAAYAVLTGLDVTVERNASGLMRHMLAAALSTALIGLDDRGRITVFNAGAEQILGYDSYAALGMDFTELLEPDAFAAWTAEQEAPATFDTLASSMTGGRTISEDWRWCRGDGSSTLVSMTLSVVEDSYGHQVGYLCVASDVTDVRRSEELLVSALEKERLVVDRLRDLDAAKDEFVSTVSHELRTPVANIVGYTEVLIDRGFGDVAEEQLSALDAINRNGERLITLANNLLTLNGLAADSLRWERTEVDLTQTVRAAESAVAPLLKERDIAVSFQSPAWPVVVLGDGPHLERVLTNLLSNAVKFTEDGGSVACRLDTRPDEAMITVRDTGLGIPKEEQQGLFDRFWRSSTSQLRHIQGTGLGLAIVQAVVAAHGGTVSIESEHLQGTTVSVTLPLHRERTRRLGSTG
ncbi:ATP-binding protein [uncultured Nocardioides sp.]|uniref:ATP-binding protein n=1 Tax=uncultured Nocardioides sp. TaxID=198441 RepID=UPI0025F0DCB6|nr:ATP-binding protein [uncultured Nocardioides sp.]